MSAQLWIRVGFLGVMLAVIILASWDLKAETHWKAGGASLNQFPCTQSSQYDNNPAPGSEPVYQDPPACINPNASSVGLFDPTAAPVAQPAEPEERPAAR